MIGQQFVTDSDYKDSEVKVDRAVTFYVTTDAPVFCQIARLNPKDGSRIWELADTPLPAIDISFEKCAGVRFKSNGATPANVFVVWTFANDDVLIRRFSSNGPFGSGGGGGRVVTVPVSSAQILDLANTTVKLIPGVAGKVIVVTGNGIAYLAGATPYTDTGGTIEVITSGVGFAWSSQNGAGFWDQASSQVSVAGFGTAEASAALLGVEGQDVVLSLQNLTSPILGDGTLLVSLSYFYAPVVP